jgi:nucleoside-diphosphate-sugar epimerase
MHIAITGARGRVGRYITDAALARGHEIVAIDRLPAETPPPPGQRDLVADATDYAALLAAFADCDALIHLAAIPHPLTDPDHIVHNHNVTSSYNALRAAIELGITRICQASSINAIGLSFSRAPHFDYFPVDERHPTHNEEAYGLSKWICEAQADSLARRYDNVRIASMRLHFVTDSRETARSHAGNTPEQRARELYGYTRGDATADACLKSLEASFSGHEVFNLVAPDTLLDTPTLEVAQRLYPDVEIRKPLVGNSSFFDSSKAERLLGWVHPRG